MVHRLSTTTLFYKGSIHVPIVLISREGLREFMHSCCHHLVQLQRSITIKNQLQLVIVVNYHYAVIVPNYKLHNYN